MAERSRQAATPEAVEGVFEAAYLLDITPALIDAAAALEPPMLRSLDAIHLATALSIDDPLLELITYDERQGRRRARERPGGRRAGR